MRNTHLQTADDLDLSRRSFLKLGVGGAVVLGSTSLVASLAGCGSTKEATAQSYRFLRDADLVLFRGLSPVILDGLLPDEQTARESKITEVLHRIDAACIPLGPPAQAQIRQLFDLLNLRATRFLTTGIAASWTDAGQVDIDNFLLRWRNSSIGMFNAGYRVLIKLVSTSYFAIPASWPQAGYPGPLDWVYKAVNS